MNKKTSQEILNWLMDVIVAFTFMTAGGIFALQKTLYGEITAIIVMLAGWGFLFLNRTWRKPTKEKGL